METETASSSFSVDPDLEDHPPSKLVPVIIGVNVDRVDLAFHVVVNVGRQIEELDCHNRLRIGRLKWIVRGRGLERETETESKSLGRTAGPLLASFPLSLL